jgi:hypothetical protein
MLCATLSLSAFTAFENGKWKADIITPAKPNQSEAFAAKELQYHLFKITGKKPQIITEKQKSSQKFHFYIGGTQAAAKAKINKKSLAMDSRVIRTVKDGIILTGGDRDGYYVGHQWSATCHGTLYAVYDFLEHDLGVLWLWPGELGEVIPQKKVLKIGKIDRAGQEKLMARRLRVGRPNAKRMTGWKKLENRTKFFADQDLFLIRHRMGANVNLYQGHAFSKYWKTYGKEHPEYFAMLPNGKRETLIGDKAGDYITMCVSNPDLHKLIVKNWKISSERRTAATPWQALINVCENDTPGMCICDNCRAWDAKDPRFAQSDYWGKKKDPLTRLGRFYRLARVKWGEDGDATKVIEPPSLSDRYAKFYMAVLKEAQKVDPEAKVFAYAYANYVDEPKETKLDKNVILCYVASIGFPYSADDSQKLRRQVSGWRKAGIERFVLRPNYLLMGGNMPINSGRRIAEDFSYIFKNGMIGTNFDSLTGVWANQGAMLYTLSRIHRKPDLGYEKSIAEYCSAFAPAEKEIRAYIDFWENFSNNITDEEFLKICAVNPDRTGNSGGGHRNFPTIIADLYPEKVFVQANKLLDAASKRAAGNTLALKRIDFLRKGLRDAELTRNCRALEKLWKSKSSNAERIKLRDKFNAAFQQLVQYRASVEADGICNYSHYTLKEAAALGWRHKSVNLKRK